MNINQLWGFVVMIRKRKMFFMLTSVIIIFCALFFVSCAAENKVSVNGSSQGVAIKGYDPVAYFTDSKPVRTVIGIFHAKKTLSSLKATPQSTPPSIKDTAPLP